MSRHHESNQEEEFRSMTLEELPNLPLFYHLQQKHETFSGAKLDDVILNTKKCLRILSIKANYNKETATIHAETFDHVKLNICFYKCIQDDAKVDSFIMEIKRLSSANFEFCGVTKTIFDFAKGNIESTPFSGRNQRMLAAPGGENVLLSEEMKEEYNGALCDVLLLLNKDRQDVHELGMESMVYLTDIHCSVEDVARKVSEAIFYGRDSFQVIQVKIYNLIQNGTMDAHDQNATSTVKYEHDDHNKKMRRWALKVLGNSLDTFLHFNENNVDELSLADNIWFQEELCDVLLQDLKEALINPHEAYLASKCLHTMMKLYDGFRIRVKNVSSVHGILKDAENTGKNHHSLLANETSHLLKTLRS